MSSAASQVSCSGQKRNNKKISRKNHFLRFVLSWRVILPLSRDEFPHPAGFYLLPFSGRDGSISVPFILNPILSKGPVMISTGPFAVHLSPAPKRRTIRKTFSEQSIKLILTFVIVLYCSQRNSVSPPGSNLLVLLIRRCASCLFLSSGGALSPRRRFPYGLKKTASVFNGRSNNIFKKIYFSFSFI